MLDQRQPQEQTSWAMPAGACLDKIRSSDASWVSVRLLRKAAAAVVVPGVVLLNCICVCVPSAAAPSTERHAHCRDAQRSNHQGTTPHPFSGSCPHCDHVQVGATKTDSGAAIVPSLYSVTTAFLSHVATPDATTATLRRPLAVVHSPPTLALLRQKCVLLI